ncbi:MAG: hypothetical protein WBE76_21940 [Terracidiphilus sp.]
MTTNLRALPISLVLLALGAAHCHAAELRVSRQALERTLQQQLFSGPDGRYYLKGNAQTACAVYGEDPHLSFAGDRILVRLKTHARLGKAVGGACLGDCPQPDRRGLGCSRRRRRDYRLP